MKKPSNSSVTSLNEYFDPEFIQEVNRIYEEAVKNEAKNLIMKYDQINEILQKYRLDVQIGPNGPNNWTAEVVTGNAYAMSHGTTPMEAFITLIQELEEEEN